MDTIRNNDIGLANVTNRRIKEKTMIEKLDIKNGGVEDLLNCIKKINEIIELLNAIVVDVDGIKCVDGSKAPAENVLTKSLRMDKEFAEAECVRLQTELKCTRKALDKGMEHITGLNNMIESWLILIDSDLDQETKLRILKSAISAYVETKGGDNE